MGTKVAPTYATLTLGYLEEKLHEQILSLWGEEEARSIKSSWKRFLDDCFILWNNSDENLKIFHQLVNNLDPNIKFTLESSDTKLPFLDVLVIKKNWKLLTVIYYKTTDTHQYLHFNSCHPHHTKTAIPYNLARRICTIVSDENTQDISLRELKHYLTNQGYPEGLIDDRIRKARKYDRSELLASKHPEKTIDIIPFVHTFNPRNMNITPIIHQFNNILINHQSTKEIYIYVNFINSRRQPKNLKRILCTSHFDTNHTY